MDPNQGTPPMMQPPHGQRRALGDNGAGAPAANLAPQQAPPPIEAPVPPKQPEEGAAPPWAQQPQVQLSALHPQAEHSLRTGLTSGAPLEQLLEFLEPQGVTEAHVRVIAAELGVEVLVKQPQLPEIDPPPPAQNEAVVAWTGNESWWGPGIPVEVAPTQECVNVLAKRGLCFRPGEKPGTYVTAATENVPPMARAPGTAPPPGAPGGPPPADPSPPPEKMRTRFNKKDEPKMLELLAAGKNPQEISVAIGLVLNSVERNVKRLIKENPNLAMQQQHPPEATNPAWLVLGGAMPGLPETAPGADIVALVKDKGWAFKWDSTRGVYLIIDPKLPNCGIQVEGVGGSHVENNQFNVSEHAELTARAQAGADAAGNSPLEAPAPHVATEPGSTMARAQYCLDHVLSLAHHTGLTYSEIRTAAELLNNVYVVEQ